MARHAGGTGWAIIGRDLGLAPHIARTAAEQQAWLDQRADRAARRAADAAPGHDDATRRRIESQVARGVSRRDAEVEAMQWHDRRRWG
ncbi:hypothetical protein EOD42_08975 [Rhodovarius crocodyli]|uniref:Uncharacterized protein n=1 Tax=Rhodovarius crocodyli TaxID=1979269 RepID=A0A437MJU2_9PROT|nr:hypothetical protein [Rhodovarius crocodyli]RVT97912.1 hypothetical protein EOD42_08975 [Rhodovarius crocodyli]